MSAPRLFAWGLLLAALAGMAVLFTKAGPTSAPVAQSAKPTPPPPSKPAPRPRSTPSPEATPAPYVIKRVLDTGGPIPFGRWFWEDTGVPDGPVLITVDTAAEVLSVFRGGYEIGTTAVIYGADQKPTPLGVFPILQKDADHVSNLYNAPMPYMLRMTNDGVSIHGSAIDASYATHGCIGVPKAFARKLFAAVRLGDKVVVTRGERLSVGGAVGAMR